MSLLFAARVCRAEGDRREMRSARKNVGPQARSLASSGQQKRNVKARLTAERRRIHSELTREEWLPVDELAEGWQERDSPSEDVSRELEYGHRDALHRRLLQINMALERLKAGAYGICATCSGLIEPNRLELDPAASLCLRCQTLAEQGIKHQSL